MKSAIYLIKPVAIVEENLPYEYSELEESIVSFLLEKAVVMREVPFVRAMEQLEKNANVNKIYA
jgi:putative effector of murein hydrolase